MSGITGAALATALAERLGEHVPQPFSVKAEGASVAFYGHSWAIATMMEILDDPQDSRSLEEKLYTATERTLDYLQDYIIESIAVRWPDPDRMQLAGAEVLSDRIELWYGDRDDPALRLRDIPLDELKTL